MIKEVNLKDIANVESSLAMLRIEIEQAPSDKITVIKFLHGYGSHGRGGLILKEIRNELASLKRRGKIKNYFNGDKWNLFEKEVVSILNKDKTIVGDVDLNRNNPGITIVEV